MHDVANKYDCNRYIKYKHTVKSAVWNEAKGKWEVDVQNGDGALVHDEVDVFINAGGVLKYVYQQLCFLDNVKLTMEQ